MPADERNRVPRGPVSPRVQLNRLLTPMEVASSIENFRVTREGSLRSVVGPTPYLPKYKNAQVDQTPAKKGVENYTTMHGIFHALVGNGQRDILLLHVGKELWVFEGWSKCWRPLISATNTFAQIQVDLHDDVRSRSPTQFVATPNGVVIIPQAEGDRRPYFYDGEVILPLGYSEIPSAPTPHGPTSSSSHDSGRKVNTQGYSLRRHTMNRSRAVMSFNHSKYGTGRIGTISTVPDQNHELTGEERQEKGSAIGCPYLLGGEWIGATQWIDYFGNLSPVSQSSQSVRLYRRPIGWNDDEPHPGETLQHQVVWASIPQGPKGTIGRVLYRTKDVLNSGSNQLYQLPSSALGRSTNRSIELISSAQFATVPENCSRLFPDNVPDSALILEAQDIVPVPKFRVATLAMGRLFVGNLESDPGAIMYSVPGRWGTFERQSILFPDPSGGVITGLWKISGGVLAFTESSAYAVVPSDDGIGLRSYPISSTIGCSSPRSIAEMPNGMIIWLTQDGFYGFDGKEVVALFNGLEEEVNLFNRSRLMQATSAIDYDSKEYICWLATEDSVYNNRGYVFDGQGWKIRTGAKYIDMCTTRDHRKYVVACGRIHGDYSNNLVSATTPPTNPFGDKGESGGASSDNSSTGIPWEKPSSSSQETRVRGIAPSDSDIEKYLVPDPDITVRREKIPEYDTDLTTIVRTRPTDEDNAWWGVWVLDHETRNFYSNPSFRRPVFETAWIGAGEHARKTALTVTVWFRETSATQQMKVRVYRDWRKDEQVHEFQIDLDSPEDPSPAWSQTNNEDNETWKKRRPYWIRKDIYIPSCEVFKLRFEGMIQTETVDTQLSLETGEFEFRAYDSVSDIEFIGLRVEESPRAGGARMPRGKED
jgi:hypothetical protein